MSEAQDKPLPYRPSHETMTFQRTFIHYLVPHRNKMVFGNSNSNYLKGWSTVPWQHTGYYLTNADIVGTANLSTK